MGDALAEAAAAGHLVIQVDGIQVPAHLGEGPHQGVIDDLLIDGGLAHVKGRRSFACIHRGVLCLFVFSQL